MKSDANLNATPEKRNGPFEVVCLMSVIMIGLCVTLLEIYIAVSWDDTRIVQNHSSQQLQQEAAVDAQSEQQPIELAYVDALGTQALFLSEGR